MNAPNAISQSLDGRPELELKPPTSSTSEKEHDLAHTTVIYEGAAGHRLRTSQLEVVGISDDGLEHALQGALDEGAKRIELCGGMGIAELVRARDLVAGRIPVRLLRYGFESLELIADCKRAFAAGDQRPAVFLYPATAGTQPVEHSDVTILPVHDYDHAERIGEHLTAEGVGLVELYGGLGPTTAAAVFWGAKGAVPVGFVDA